MFIRTNVSIPTVDKKVKPEVKKEEVKVVEKPVLTSAKRKKVAVPVQPVVELDEADEIIKKVSEWDFED